MRLSKIFNLLSGKAVEGDLGLEANSADMVLLMAHDQNEPMYIAGTSSELYDSHDYRDLGVWFDYDEETE